jgi:uncharacterized damage-inducible protein DinB
MSQVRKWFERKFDFSFPAELYPNLCIRLRGTPCQLEELVRTTPRDILTQKQGENWSAQEHAGHLLDLEPLGLARLDDYEKGSEILSPADLTNKKTFAGNYNSRDAEEILGTFRKERLQFMNRLSSLDASLHPRIALHPRLKIPMRLVDFLFFVAEHDDHHLARIWELTAQPRSTV